MRSNAGSVELIGQGFHLVLSAKCTQRTLRTAGSSILQPTQYTDDALALNNF